MWGLRGMGFQVYSSTCWWKLAAFWRLQPNAMVATQCHQPTINASICEWLKFHPLKMVKTRGWWLGSQGLPTKYLIQSHYIPLKPPFLMVKSPSLMLKRHFFIRCSRSKVLTSPTSFWQFDNAIFQLLSTNFSRWKSDFADAALHGAGFGKFFAPTKVSRSPRVGSGEVAVSGLHVIFWWPNLVPNFGMFSHHNCVSCVVCVCVCQG